MSHIGSGAAILQHRLENELARSVTSNEFAPRTWDEWNAKTPRAQVDDGHTADAELLAALDALSDAERDGFTFTMGPISVDFEGFVGLRLNEHGLHTWDIDGTLERAATIPDPIAAHLIDRVELVAGYTDQPTTGAPATIAVRTTEPDRRFEIELTAGGATPTPTTSATDAADIELPAEAFARPVYGRLDPDHTPPLPSDSDILDRLRATYPRSLTERRPRPPAAEPPHRKEHALTTAHAQHAHRGRPQPARARRADGHHPVGDLPARGGRGARNRIDTLARAATALDRHLVVSFPEKVPAKLKYAVQVA